MLFIKLCIVCFKGFEATAKLVCKSCTIKALIKSDLYTIRCQQGSQGYISITEYHETVISYLCVRFINDETAKKKKKRSSRKIEDTYTTCNGASNVKLVQCKEQKH